MKASTSHGHTLETIFLLAASLVVFLLYSVSLEGGFVLDDKNNIEKNPSIRITHLSAAGLHDAARQSVLPTRPVANISFAMNHLLHGYDVRGFRLVNVLLHIVTGIILYRFLAALLAIPAVKKRYGPPGLVPLLAAVFWLVHPAQTQAVNYIVQRMAILAALFYILALYLYLKGRAASAPRQRILYFGGTLLAALCGLGSKETVAMLPLFLLLLEWYFLRDPEKPFSGKMVAAAVVFCVAACFLVFFYLGTNPFAAIGASYSGRDFSLGERLLTQSRVVLFYLGLLFLPLPTRLNLEHDFLLSTSLLAPPATLPAMALIFFLVVLALIRAKKDPLLSFVILWYFGNLLIESSVIGLEIIFEHRVYLPAMLVVLPILLRARTILPAALPRAVLLAGLFSCLLLWTYQRNTVWADTVSLLSDSVGKAPASYRAHLNLGIALKNRGRLDAAIDHYYKALSVKGDYVEGYYNLGNALMLKNDFRGAAENYFKALALGPTDVDTHYNLGYTLAKLRRFDEAVYHYSEAIRLQPGFIEARRELAELRRSMQKLYRKQKPAE
jgi:tetratricopeptide (TPR) repeat protein